MCHLTVLSGMLCALLYYKYECKCFIGKFLFCGLLYGLCLCRVCRGEGKLGGFREFTLAVIGFCDQE